MTTTARNKAHCLSVTMETQAYHCSLTVHVLFLLGAIGGRSFGESVRESLAIKLLPVSKKLTVFLAEKIESCDCHVTAGAAEEGGARVE